LIIEEKKSIASGDKQRWGMPLLPTLLLPAGISELLYVLVVVITPLPGLRLMPTPLMAWSWILAPSHWLFPGAWTTTGGTQQYDWPHIVLFAIVLIALVGAYTLALITVLRRKDEVNAANVSSRWLLVILGTVLVFSLTLLFQPTILSDDVFSYIFSGRLLAVYHVDPLNSIPAAFPGDPYLQWVISGRNSTNIYGPLWLYFASLLVALGNSPITTLLLFKGVAILSHLANCLLLWAILGKIAPARRLLGTLIYAWNPLILLELAGSGHSDGLLITIFLLATWIYVRDNKGRWHQLAMLVTLGFAVSMNFIALLITPLFIWFLVRTKPSFIRSMWAFCWRLCVSLVVTVLISVPFWRGASTFFAVTSGIDMAHFEHAPIGLLIQPMRWFFGLVAQWANFPPVMQPTTAADTTLRASTIFIFALIFFYLYGKVRHATTTIGGMRYDPNADQQMILPGFDVLLDSCCQVVFWYLTLVQGLFWPWYVLWALWIVALRRFDARTITILLLSCTALLSYPLLAFVGTPVAEYQSLFVFGIPIMYIVLNWKHWNERNKPSYE
jgi:hypothetical protein